MWEAEKIKDLFFLVFVNRLLFLEDFLWISKSLSRESLVLLHSQIDHQIGPQYEGSLECLAIFD